MIKATRFDADEQGVQRLLHDIDVELNIAYADSGRVLFPELSPYYARLIDHPLVERLALSAKAAADSTEGQNFRRYVSEALQRASNMSLGNSRTLILIDLAHQVAPEAFSYWLWRRLLWRAELSSQPRWLGDLAVRLEEWKIYLGLDVKDWKSLIEAVEPLGFESLLRWSFLQAHGMSLSERERHLQQLMSMAGQRLRNDSRQFSAADVNPLETSERLTDLLLADWRLCLNQSEDNFDEWKNERATEALRRSIERTQHTRDRYIPDAALNEDAVFPELADA